MELLSSKAATVFKDPLSITTFDTDHSEDEERFIIFGSSAAGRLLMFAHTDRGDRIGIISEGELTRREGRAYEEEIERRKG